MGNSVADTPDPGKPGPTDETAPQAKQDAADGAEAGSTGQPPSGEGDPPPARGLLGRLLSVFGDRPLELAGVVLTLGSFLALLFLILASFVPSAPELALIKGFQSLLTMASIGIIAVIASRQTEKFITALAIVIVAIVFVSVDDLVRLYVTVTGSERDISGVLSRRSTGRGEVAGGKQDFRDTARRIREMIEARHEDFALSENSARLLQEEIRQIILQAEHSAIVERITNKGADELLSEIHDGEFVVSFLKYEGFPEFQSDLQLLRYEGLIDDRYGDMPDTMELTDLGCRILELTRNADLGCQDPEAVEIEPETVSPQYTIDVDERLEVSVAGDPVVLTLNLRREQLLQIDAVPAGGQDLDPYLEIFRGDDDATIEFFDYDDDSGGGLNARVSNRFPADRYLIYVFDLFGESGRISVSVNARAESEVQATRETFTLAANTEPLTSDLFIGSDSGEEFELEITGPSRRVRFAAQSEWLDTLVEIYRIGSPGESAGEWNLVARNDDGGVELNSCVDLEVEAGLYLIRVTDYDNFTGEATATIANADDARADEECEFQFRSGRGVESAEQ